MADADARAEVSRPHLLRVRWDDGWQVWVDCPDAHLGDKRPCAVWANDDGSKRDDACTFEQYADDCFPEDWLHGPIDFAPALIVEAGWGDDWRAVAAPSDTDSFGLPKGEWSAPIGPADSTEVAS